MKHGTVNGYATYGCRCEPCREAMRLYDLERRGFVVDREAMSDLLHELFPYGMTTPQERAAHDGLALSA